MDKGLRICCEEKEKNFPLDSMPKDFKFACLGRVGRGEVRRNEEVYVSNPSAHLEITKYAAEMFRRR